MSFDHAKQKSRRFFKKNYNPTIGNVCYRYSRLSKEKFFKNSYCSYIFLKAVPYLEQLFQEEQPEKTPIYNEIIAQFRETALRYACK
jgi:hypothetical protein